MSNRQPAGNTNSHQQQDNTNNRRQLPAVSIMNDRQQQPSGNMNNRQQQPTDELSLLGHYRMNIRNNNRKSPSLENQALQARPGQLPPVTLIFYILMQEAYHVNKLNLLKP